MITEQQAETEGYSPLTVDYCLPSEQWMLDNVLIDMRRGGIEHVLVGAVDNAPSVWRRGGTNEDVEPADTGIVFGEN